MSTKSFSFLPYYGRQCIINKNGKTYVSGFFLCVRFFDVRVALFLPLKSVSRCALYSLEREWGCSMRTVVAKKRLGGLNPSSTRPKGVHIYGTVLWQANGLWQRRLEFDANWIKPFFGTGSALRLYRPTYKHISHFLKHWKKWHWVSMFSTLAVKLAVTR